jgi:hypothetical protein
MTTPTPTPTAAEQFREEIRKEFDELNAAISNLMFQVTDLRADLSQIRDGLSQAAQPTARASSGQTKTFLATAICHSVDDNGKDSFKVRGGPYARNGVRIWPEVLPLLGLDAATLPHGVTTLETPINVLVEMHDYTAPDTHETRVTPYKIIGKA